MSRLFREEVVDNRRARQYGEVAIKGAAAPWPIMMFVAGAVVLILVILGLSSFARTETATGRLVATGASSRIVPSRPGTITVLHVVEGQAVKAGQPLAAIRVAQSNQDRSDPAAEDLAALDRQRTLTTEQIALAKSDEGLEAARLQTQIVGMRSQIAAIDDQLRNYMEIAKSSRETIVHLQGLVSKGFMSKLDFDRHQQELLGQQAAIAQIRGQRAALLGQLQQSSEALAELHNKTSTRISDLDVSASQLTERRIEAEMARGYVITAPVSGHVSGLQAAVGSTVSQALPLMTIVADNTPLFAELYVPTRARGFATVGQKVRLNYDAFPFDRYGSYVGSISSISKTVVDASDVDPAVQTREPVYIARVRLPEQFVAAFGQRISLQPGMTLSGIIVLEKRSFLRWLLEPFYAVSNRR